MRKLMVLGAAALLAASFNAAAADKPAPPKVAAASVVTMTATVQDIDVASRFVTLKDEDGKLRTVQVGEQVKNLAQVKVGDVVVARYVRAVALELKKGGSGVRSASEKEGLATAKPGEKPAGVAAEQTTVVATVEKVEHQEAPGDRQGTARQHGGRRGQGPEETETGQGRRRGRDYLHRSSRHLRGITEEMSPGRAGGGQIGPPPARVVVAPRLSRRRPASAAAAI